jgi:hypothetical protein
MMVIYNKLTTHYVDPFTHTVYVVLAQRTNKMFYLCTSVVDNRVWYEVFYLDTNQVITYDTFAEAVVAYNA